MKVERRDVARWTRVTFPDGQTDVAEGQEYLAECGCKVIYGMRLDKNEVCMGVYPCGAHDEADLGRKLVEAGTKGHPLYECETADVIAAVLA